MLSWRMKFKKGIKKPAKIFDIISGLIQSAQATYRLSMDLHQHHYWPDCRLIFHPLAG